MKSSHEDATDEAPSKDQQGDSVQLTGPLLIIGVIAILVGIGCGLVMSTATFFR